MIPKQFDLIYWKFRNKSRIILNVIENVLISWQKWENNSKQPNDVESPVFDDE